MSNPCSTVAGSPAIRATSLVVALAAMLAVPILAEAASIGHSRLISAPGQPLSINVPLRDLTDADLQSLRVAAAPAAAWRQAGLLPPVELSSLRFNLEAGFAPGSRVIQVRSSQPFDGPVADLLIQVDTAAGSQLHQVSLLAQASPPGVASTQAGASSAGPALSSGAVVGAPPASRSIEVQRGDTLFALALVNAVEGVTVYQMMVALQKANPQAFINSNMNLVKAGATLTIPNAAALREVSDRQARRIFQQQAQAYAAYRDRIAARRGEAVRGGSTLQGPVSRPPVRPAAAAPAALGDQVVLSSGQASDAARDEQAATRRNIDESQARVSELDRNVQSLNQALQMQGEAAKDAVFEGAAAVGQTLSEAASSLGFSENGNTTASDGASGASSDRDASARANGSGQPATAAQSVPTDRPSAADQKAATDRGSAEQSGAAVQEDAASAATSDAQADAPAQNGAARQTGVPAQAGNSNGPAFDAEQRSSESVRGTSQDNSSSSSKAEQPVSWFQENMLGVITGILALVVLIIAWLLRRASASRSDDGHAGVTEAMVQERLDSIDFDLDSPPADPRPPHSS